MLWSVVAPMLLLVSYQVVFSQVFPTRWPEAVGERPPPFSLMVFSGILVFGLFAECIGRAPSLIQGQRNFVKRIVFPLECLAYVVLLTSLFHFLAGISVLSLFFLFTVGSIPKAIALALIAVVPILILSLALIWALSSLGVYLRDLQHSIPVVITLLFFFSPIFFSMHAIEDAGLRRLLEFNPIGVAMEEFRSILFFGRSIDTASWLKQALISLLALYFGLWLFRRVRGGFSDVV
jgi:lipopolysaccharide transport system permease protein